VKYFDLGDRVVTSCPKAGSRAIQRSLGGSEIIVHQAIGRRVICFLRHPIERLISAYRWFNYTEGWQRDMPFYGKKCTWEGFVDSVLNGDRNRHWLPQSELLSHGNHFVPTEVYRFEDINELWPKLIGTPLERINQSNMAPVNDQYRRAELDNLYAEDLGRWDTALLSAKAPRS
jgi:hypothetical protein